MRFKINFEATVKIPSLPNFIIIEGKEKITVPVQDFSNEELLKIAEQWTRELINAAEAKREKETQSE